MVFLRTQILLKTERKKAEGEGTKRGIHRKVGLMIYADAQ
jgi:hypothetical protein